MLTIDKGRFVIWATLGFLVVFICSFQLGSHYGAEQKREELVKRPFIQACSQDGGSVYGWDDSVCLLPNGTYRERKAVVSASEMAVDTPPAMA